MSETTETSTEQAGGCGCGHCGCGAQSEEGLTIVAQES